jgi:hypothetical protein
MSTSSSCYARFQTEIETYETFLFTSLGLTAFNLVTSRVLVARQTTHTKLAYYHGIAGLIKVCLALGIFVMTPTCPSGCTCTGGFAHPTLAIIPLILGFLWLHRGYTYYKQAQNEFQYAELT